MALAGSGAGPPGGEPPRPPHGQKRPGAEAEYPGQSKAAKRRARRDRVEKEVAEMGPAHPGWVCDPRRPDRDEYRQMRDMARQEGYQVPSLPSGHQQPGGVTPPRQQPGGVTPPLQKKWTSVGVS